MPSDRQRELSAFLAAAQLAEECLAAYLGQPGSRPSMPRKEQEEYEELDHDWHLLNDCRHVRLGLRLFRSLVFGWGVHDDPALLQQLRGLTPVQVPRDAQRLAEAFEASKRLCGHVLARAGQPLPG